MNKPIQSVALLEQPVEKKGQIPKWQGGKTVLVCAATGFILLGALLCLPPGRDWQQCYVNVVRLWRQPYTVEGFYNPPWVLPIIAPLALLPSRVGQAVNGLVALTTAALLVRRFQGNGVSLAAALLAPPTLFLLMNGNIEWVVMAGLLLPPKWGLILILVKPQSAVGVSLVWLRRAPNKALFLLPAICVFVASFAIWEWWLTSMLSARFVSWNLSLWPWSIPLGLIGLVIAVWHQDESLAVASTPLLAPYLGVVSLWPALIVLASRRSWCGLFAVGIMWIAIGLRLTAWS